MVACALDLMLMDGEHARALIWTRLAQTAWHREEEGRRAG